MFLADGPEGPSSSSLALHKREPVCVVGSTGEMSSTTWQGRPMAYAGMKARLVAAALLGFGGLFGAAHAQESKLTPFVVGQSAPSNTFLAIWMAEAAGLYQAQGL